MSKEFVYSIEDFYSFFEETPAPENVPNFEYFGSVEVIKPVGQEKPNIPDLLGQHNTHAHKTEKPRFGIRQQKQQKPAVVQRKIPQSTVTVEPEAKDLKISWGKPASVAVPPAPIDTPKAEEPIEKPVEKVEAAPAPAPIQKPAPAKPALSWGSVDLGGSPAKSVQQPKRMTPKISFDDLEKEEAAKPKPKPMIPKPTEEKAPETEPKPMPKSTEKHENNNRRTNQKYKQQRAPQKGQEKPKPAEQPQPKPEPSPADAQWPSLGGAVKPKPAKIAAWGKVGQ